MSDRPLPGTLFQIGYVVPNLDAALAHLNTKLGAPRFMVLRENRRREWLVQRI
jgi:hypothetical protein